MSLVGLILASLTHLQLLSHHRRVDALPVAIMIILLTADHLDLPSITSEVQT